MNKAKLVEQVAKSTKLSKSSAKQALEAVIDAIGQALKKNKSVVITGFGTFSVVKRKSRMGVNPATGEKMKIEAKKVVKFKPGKALRESVAKK